MTIQRNDNGILIVFEGIDGAGKTTQLHLLAESLKKRGEQVVVSKEPTDGPWGRKLRASAQQGRLSLVEELEAFLEDRKQHVQTIIAPALQQGQLVILDRYFYSTAAYQGARGADVDEIMRRNLEFAPEPDAVIFLDIPADVGVSRISQGRGETPNLFEKQSELEKIREIFLRLCSQYNVIKRVSAQQPIDDVQSSIQAIVDGVMKNKRGANTNTT